MQVSVRDLKEHLSHYLRAVQAGEAVLVTSHNRPVARIEPVRETPPREAVERLAAAEGVRWAGGKPAGTRIVPAGEGMTAAEMVLEDRG